MVLKGVQQLGEEPALPCYFQLCCAVPLPLLHTGLWRQTAAEVSGTHKQICSPAAILAGTRFNTGVPTDAH